MTLRGGRYEILGTIAAGGMATVHLGRALGAGGFERLVAVKTMHAHIAQDPEFVAMFLDEARLAARIRHANVVGTLDIQQDAEGLFLVMEYVEGASLSRILKGLSKKESRLPLDVALRVFGDSLAGLHAAHELTGPGGEALNLIHRDVSPHNILVGTDGAARITDFGVARAESRLATTRTGSMKGKVMYMAPEQVRAEPIDRRADIYAAGVVLWEMLTGQRLVSADSHVAMMHQITEEPQRSPSQVNPGVPAPVSAACMRALERDREARYPTAAAFAEALEKAATASGVRAAAPRAVAAMLRELDPQIENMALRIADGTHRPALPSQTLASAAGSSAGDAGSADSGRANGPANAATAVEQGPRSASTRATFSSPSELAPVSRRSRRGLLFAAAGLLGLAAGVWFIFGRGPAKSEGSAPAASQEAARPASAPSPSGAAPDVVPSPAVSAASTAATATATASNAATAPTATATATAAAAAPNSKGAAPRATTTGAPRTFRPREL